jgi:hypothetical protein
MTKRYTATIEASGSTVTADIDENDDVEGGRGGALLLYYDGPETGRSLPEKVGERHFYDAEGLGDSEGGQVNFDNGATVDFDVPQTYVVGAGIWTLHHDADDTPIARVTAAEARGEDNAESVPATEVRQLREQLAKERERNERQDEAIAELRSELDDVETEADVQVDDGGDDTEIGGVARLILDRLSG